MKTIILAGGLGSRMREETEFKPKPMVEIGGKPVIWHIIKNYIHQGHNDFIICMGYKKEQIINYFTNYSSYNSDIKIDLNKNKIHALTKTNDDLINAKITLADTGLNSDTGERIRRIKEHINENETFMMTYGDGLANINLEDLVKFHENHNGVATFTITHPQSRFGIVETNLQNLVTSFSEKGKSQNKINCGFMVLDYKVFDYIEENDNFEMQSLKRIIEDNKLYAFDHDGYFQPMDTYREYKSLNDLWENGKAPWKTWNG
tara:strand:- start:632 stop:1414 length:783 start_codon:yes stop_codon:yes gene_type:complete